MLDRIHRAHQWTVNPWNASEDTERDWVWCLAACLECPHLLNTNIVIIITTWTHDARADYKTGTLRIYLYYYSMLLTLSVWCHVSGRVIGHVCHVCQEEDGHQNTRDTRHTCYNHWFECSERVQKFRAWEIHNMSRDSQSANECLEQLMSYSFR